MKIFCADLKREINKRECLPDKSSDVCKTCPEKTKNNLNSISKPRQIADFYLKNPKKLPFPLWRWQDFVVEKDFRGAFEKNISKKNLNILKKYPKEKVLQVYQSLIVFYESLYIIEKNIPIIMEAKNSNRKAKSALKAINTLLDARFFLYGTMESICLIDIKERIEKYINGKTDYISPLSVLEYACMSGYEKDAYLNYIPLKLKIGNPGQSLFKALQIVIYKLLDTGRNKKHTESIVADIINCFFENYTNIDNTMHRKYIESFRTISAKRNAEAFFGPPIKKLNFKKLIPKDINNALHSS